MFAIFPSACERPGNKGSTCENHWLPVRVGENSPLNAVCSFLSDRPLIDSVFSICSGIGFYCWLASVVKSCYPALFKQAPNFPGNLLHAGGAGLFFEWLCV